VWSPEKIRTKSPQSRFRPGAFTEGTSNLKRKKKKKIDASSAARGANDILIAEDTEKKNRKTDGGKNSATEVKSLCPPKKSSSLAPVSGHKPGEKTSWEKKNDAKEKGIATHQQQQNTS